MKKFKKGFTLIELLVVISIIGLLSSIVLASLSTARSKAKTATIKSGMIQMRTQLALYQSIFDSYGAVSGCSNVTPNAFTYAGAPSILANLQTQGATNISCTSDTITNTSKWALYVNLPTGGFWCVDSSGNAAAVSDAGTPDGVCG